MKPLTRKQSMKNEEWLNAIAEIESTVPKKELMQLVNATVKQIKQTVKGKTAAYAWSAGKDSIVLGSLCEKAGIKMSMCGVCNLEYPAFMKWINENKPEQCEIINTGQDLTWLAKHQDMLFPQDSKKAARWFAIVQHKAQQDYFKDKNLDMLILGRRRADGNYVGRDGIYTNQNGITRYSPLSEWKHEHILAYIHYFELPLPPIYEWKNGYLCGTHPWPARQWTESIENGWKEVYDIDKNIVIEAAEYIDSAKTFLSEVRA